MGITKYLIENPIVKWMVLGILFFAAFFAITNIKRFAYPRVNLNEITISTVVPGFSINEIETQVTHKINEKLKAIQGIKKFNSTSRPNHSFVFIEIDPDSDVDEVKTKIRNEIDSINDFPEEMTSNPKISEIKIDNKPTMTLGITPQDYRNFDPLVLSRETINLRDLLQNSDLVSQIYEDIPKPQVQILLNKEKMEAHQITFEEVYNKIIHDQIRLSAGTLESQSEVKSIITLSEKQNLKDIQNIILRTQGYKLPQSPIVRIKDIGKVVLTLEKQDFVFHINGIPGYKIEVVKKPQTDIIEFSQAINLLLEKYQQTHKNTKVSVHENDSWETEQRLSITLNNGYSSLALIAVTLLLFLKLPIAFWAIFEMPVTILLSSILIWTADVTINNISLCGIILTLGIVVDNPTIIGELTMYYQEKGYKLEEASLMGLKKIFKPLLFSLLTTMASFASMFFIPGILGDFAIEIPITVTFMLITSFIEAVFILPSHLAHTRPYHSEPWGNRLLVFLKKIYHVSIRNTLKYPFWFLVSITFVVGVATWWASQGINFYLFSTEQSNKIFITGKTPSNSNLNFTESQASQIEKLIDKLPEGTVLSYITKVGSENFNSFNIEIVLTPFYERDLNANQIRERLTQEVKQMNLSLNTIDYTVESGGPPSGKPIEINIFHPDFEVRKVVVNRIMNDLKTNSIFTEVNSDFEEGVPEIQVKPKPEMYFAGITPDSVAQILRFAFEGVKVKETEVNGENTEWVLKLDEESKNLQDPLEGLTINSPVGRVTRISQLVEISETNSIAKIIGEKGKRKNTISANFDVQKTSSQKILTELSQGYQFLSKDFSKLEITYGGEAKESFDTFRQFIFAILGSVALIYMLLVIQFKNLTQPFLVISSIPFGIAGIIIVFNLQGTNISFLTMIGILGFGGVVINSSIIMIDFINSLYKNYQESYDNNFEKSKSLTNDMNSKFSMPGLKEIVIEGALARFRPILITTSSTVIGFFPLAYAVIGQTDSTISPLSMGMVWGMLFGTISSLFVVPALYIVDNNIAIFVKRFKKRFKKK